MPAILALVAGNLGANWWLTNQTVDTDLTMAGAQPGVPTIYGYDARKIAMGTGAAAALGLIGGPLGMLLVGAGLAGYTSSYTTQKWTEAWAAFDAGESAMDDAGKLAHGGALKALSTSIFDNFLGSKADTVPAGDDDDYGDDIVGIEDYAPSMPGIC